MNEKIDIIREVNEELRESQNCGTQCSPIELKTDGEDAIVELFGVRIWSTMDGWDDIHSDDGEPFTKDNLLRQAAITYKELIHPVFCVTARSPRRTQ